MTTALFWVLFFLAWGSNHTAAQNAKGCGANAFQDENGECVCQEGFVGKGNLCCIPDDHKICMVEGDPVIRAMNEDLIPLDLPCPTLIAEVHTIGPNYDETVHAYMAGEYGNNGVLNLDYLRLEYEERFNDIHTEVEVYNGKLTINGAVHDKSQSWFSEHYEVELHYNESIDTYSMLSMGTTIVHYVPPSRASDQQGVVPGMCVGVARNSLLYDVGMCNQRRRGLQRSTANGGFQALRPGVVEYVIRLLPFFQTIGPQNVQETCLDLNRRRSPCGDRWNPTIGACYSLVSHPDIRLCLAKQGVDVLHVFSECTKAHCALDQNSCAYTKSEAVRKCIDIEPDCSALY